MAPTIAVTIDELHKMQTTEEVMNWRTIARFFHGAQWWIEEQAIRHLDRLSTTGDLHADKMTAQEAADAEFDAIVDEYRDSDEAKMWAKLYTELDLEFTFDDIEELEF